MTPHSKLLALLTTTVAVSALAACSNGDDLLTGPLPTSAPIPGAVTVPGPPTTPTLTGDPIVIGTLGSYTVAQSTGVDLALPRKALEAWSKWVNAHGGINGHPLKLVAEDDENDPVKSKTAISKLVEQDHVVAILDSDDSSFDATWTDYITSKNIPVIGGTAYSLNWLKAPFFLSGSDVITSVASQPQAAKDAGYNSIAAVLCSESAVCAQAIPLYKTAADKVGVKFTGGVLASGTAANYTAQCVQLKDAGAQAVALGGVNSTRLKQDCDRQGYQPAWILPASQFLVQYAQDAGTALAPLQAFPWFYDGPETKDFHDAMTQYGGFADKDDSVASSLAWVSGLMFQKAVQLSGATGMPTTADILKGLNSFNGETLGGLSTPLTFGDPRPNGGRNLCYFAASYQDGKFLAPNGLKTTCVQP